MKVIIERRYVVSLVFALGGPPPKDVSVVWAHDIGQAEIHAKHVFDAWSIGHWAGHFPTEFAVSHSGRAVGETEPEPDTRITIQYDKADIDEPYDKNLNTEDDLTEWHLEQWAESFHK